MRLDKALREERRKRGIPSVYDRRRTVHLGVPVKELSPFAKRLLGKTDNELRPGP